MGFLSLSFLFALPLVAVPVVIHLLSRRQKQVIRWGAMQFLLESSTRRRRIWRIDDLIIMLLRAAAVLLIVLALAQPLLRSHWLGSPAGRDVILIIDASLSTGLQSDSGRLFDRIQENAQQIIAELRDDDTVRMMLALNSPMWLTQVAVPASTESRQQLHQIVAALRPTLATADLASAVESALESEPAASSLSRQVIILTDSCVHGWQHDAIPRWNAIRKRKESMEIPTLVNVPEVAAKSGPIDNLAVEKIEATRNIVAVDEPFGLTAKVRNRGYVPSDPVVLRWSADEIPMGVASVPSLNPGQSSSIQFQHTIGAPDAYRIQCQLDNSDDLRLDDSGTTIVEVTDRVPILIVQPSPGREDEIQYVLAALGHPRNPGSVEEPTESVFVPAIMPLGDIEAVDLHSFHAVLLVNVDSIPRTIRQRLVRYVLAGGGLWISLGDRTQVETFNAEIYDEGRGLSPVSISDPAGDAGNREQFVLISPPLTEHRPTILLGDTQRLDIDQVHVYRHIPFDIDGANETVRVLLETEHGKPLAIERYLGDGRILLLGTPLDLSWSNLPLCQSYVAMVHEWLWYLTEPSATRRNVLPGAPLRMPIAANSATGSARMPDPEGDDPIQATIETPNGEQREVHAIGDGKSRAFIFRDTHLPGTYSIALHGALKDESAKSASSFYVQRDAEESNLERLNSTHRELLAQAGVSFTSHTGMQLRDSVRIASGQPIASHLLFALLLVLLSELLLVMWSASRRFGAPQVVQ